MTSQIMNDETLEKIIEEATRKIDLLFPTAQVRVTIKSAVKDACTRAWKLGYISTCKDLTLP